MERHSTISHWIDSQFIQPLHDTTISDAFFYLLKNNPVFLSLQWFYDLFKDIEQNGFTAASFNAATTSLMNVIRFNPATLMASWLTNAVGAVIFSFMSIIGTILWWACIGVAAYAFVKHISE
eukprot:NODE_1011_length_2694_cov_0.510212.p3 type:complete len:122 gc:universal NODE_1011_length_2694_cov_0.510212:2320-1955(-)